MISIYILLGTSFSCLVLTLIYFLHLCGLFRRLSAKIDKPWYPRCIYYRYLTGHYSNRTKAYRELEILCGAESKVRTMSLYYDDPYYTNSTECRCAIGVEAKEEITKRNLIQAGYMSTIFPDIDNAVIVQFHLTTIFSIQIAIWKIYPFIKWYLKANKLCAYPLIEICHDSVMTVFAPLKKQHDFFVPECADLL
ncbi:hypothetical protein GJ496_006335 [Pomphorhynchus laevis]|nr:hypothetical protein GJ496_006335 [Pomphorhynchus laevis]